MTTIQHRRGTALQWTTTNRILESGEFGVETDTLRVKLGDGSTPWTTLDYFAEDGLTPAQVQNLVATMLVEGTNIDLDYDDTAGTITVTGSGTAGSDTYISVDTSEQMKLIAFGGGVVKAIPAAAIAPDTPADLSRIANVSSVILSWTAAPRAASYRIYRDGLQIATTGGTIYHDYTVNTGDTYLYKVRSEDWYGQLSDLSDPVTAFLDPALNVPPEIEIRTWPTTLPDTGKALVRVNASDPDAQTVAMALGSDAGTVTPTQDPSLWLINL